MFKLCIVIVEVMLDPSPPGSDTRYWKDTNHSALAITLSCVIKKNRCDKDSDIFERYLEYLWRDTTMLEICLMRLSSTLFERYIWWKNTTNYQLPCILLTEEKSGTVVSNIEF